MAKLIEGQTALTTGTLFAWVVAALLAAMLMAAPLAGAEPEARVVPATAPPGEAAAQEAEAPPALPVPSLKPHAPVKPTSPPEVGGDALIGGFLKLQVKDPRNDTSTHQQLYEAQKNAAKQAVENANSCVPACKGVFFCSQGQCRHPCVNAPGSCDDGDPCTKDMCLASDGCASVKILGCVSLP